jgi:hypothetical protein
MKFSKEFLQERFWSNKNNTVYGRIADHTRWSVVYEEVFEYEGKLYLTTYSVGATEHQDESPYEYDEDEIECPEVVAVYDAVRYVPVNQEQIDG